MRCSSRAAVPKTAAPRREKRAARTAGILLHPTSLPGPDGCGDLGEPARRFVDWLAAAGQTWWQMLPIVPPGAGNSPYSAPSAFAGSELLVSLRELEREGWLSPETPPFPEARVDYAAVKPWRVKRLREAFLAFEKRADRKAAKDLRRYAKENADWLDEYALFRALKETHAGAPWKQWEPALRRREPRALKAAAKELADDVRFQVFVQWQFERQWQRVRAYAHERGVLLIGDVPIFVEHDSADAWSRRDLFQVDRGEGMPRAIAGVPPDYFSATGQLWGNPLYDWKAQKKRKYDWWVARLRRQLELFDLLRIDHFIGFHRAWALAPDAKDAVNGKWQPGPGASLFERLQKELGTPLPLIAEDLGLVIPPVKALRDQFALPGMKVLQFAFGDDTEADAYKPHNFPRHAVVYTGTHDNDTTSGWWNDQGSASSTRSREQIERERAFTLRYLGSDGREIHWDMIRAAYSSVAELALVPLQDVLGLGTEARMNRPGVAEGNWEWRFRERDLTPDHATRLRTLAETFQRANPRAASVIAARAAGGNGAAHDSAPDGEGANP